MGRRSRKRSLSGAEPPRPTAGGDESARPATSRAERDAARRRLRASGEAHGPAAWRHGSRRRRGERPQAPWGTFPLTELVVLVAIVLGIAGLVVWGARGQIMLIAGFALGSLAGLELAVREHFAGYRSHTTLLAASVAFAVGAVLVVAVTGPEARMPVLVAAVVAFGAAFYVFREAFKRRSGGLGFR
jgi:hypothetical protein